MERVGGTPEGGELRHVLPHCRWRLSLVWSIGAGEQTDEMEEKEDMIECEVGEIRVREGSGWSSCLCVPDSGRQTLLVTDGTGQGRG